MIVKNPDEAPIEQYPRSGLQAHYDGRGHLAMVEFYPNASVEIGGIELLGRRLDDVCSDLARVGLSARDDGLGDVVYDTQGFGLYVEGGQIGSVSVFSRENANRAGGA